MALVNLPGGLFVPIFPGPLNSLGGAAYSGVTIDAANEAVIWTGQICTSDGGSHTLDTTGSSSIGWVPSFVSSWASGASVVKIGIAPVDTAAGPPVRALNSSNVITFDVYGLLPGSLTAGTWNTVAITSGTKTIAHGDFVTVCIQMTTRGGADNMQVGNIAAAGALHRPLTTTYTGGSYAAFAANPNFLITFSDGTLGWMHGCEVVSIPVNQAYDSTTSPNEYGQLYQLPFPVRAHGILGNIWFQASGAGGDFSLYTDPLGTPVAQKTITIDYKQIASGAAARRLDCMFAAPYDIAANQPSVVALKATAGNLFHLGKTLPSAAARVTDPWGLSGYGVSRSGGSGAFSNINSSLTHMHAGLIASGFVHGARPSFGLGV